MNRSIIRLHNREGHALHALLEEPMEGAARAGLAAVLLCPGIKTRVGPHRLYRKLSPPFLARGIPVLRVDFRGLGDSEGDWPDDSLEQIYRLTELGHCVDDARCALDWLESQHGIHRFIVGGLCGAAITALHLALQDPRLAGLYAIGLPATLDGASQASIPRGELRSHRLRYLRKLVRPASWLRFLSMQSEYRLMWRVFAQALFNSDVPPAGAAPAPDLNPHLPAAFFALLASRRPALLMFGELDRRRWDFEEKFLEPWSKALEPYQNLITYSVISGANHVLSDPAAILATNRLTRTWLDAQFSHAEERARVPEWIAAARAHLRPHASPGTA